MTSGGELVAYHHKRKGVGKWEGGGGGSFDRPPTPPPLQRMQAFRWITSHLCGGIVRCEKTWTHGTRRVANSNQDRGAHRT